MESDAPASGRITSLQFQRKNTDWVNVYIEDEYALSVPAIDAARLRVGQTLGEEELVRLGQTAARQRAFDSAVRFLSYRPRSEKEVRDYLYHKNVPPADIEEVIGRLHGLEFLDDAEFARWWVDNRQKFRPRGTYALRGELRQKGVAEDVIEEAIAASEVDEAVLAEEVARRFMRRLKKGDKQAFARKLSAHLLGRGFASEDVYPLVHKLWDELHPADDDPLDG